VQHIRRWQTFDEISAMNNNPVDEELLAAIAQRAGQPSAVVASILDALSTVAVEFLARPGNQSITIPRLVTVEAYGVPALRGRCGISVTTGEEMEIPGAPARTKFRAQFPQEVYTAVGLKEVPEYD
jgi:hypothetical protein